MDQKYITERNNVRFIGEGEQVLMLAHGFGCDQNVWRFITPALASSYRVLLFDYVGSGHSLLGAFSVNRYSRLEGYAQDVLANPAVGQYMHQHMPNSKLVTLDTEGHCFHMSYPQKVSAEVLAFLSR